jgi:putative SOS response-associated peptidase YedK
VNHATEEVIESFAIVTTAAMPGLLVVHTRQPLLLAPNEVRNWIDPEVPFDGIAQFMKPRLPVTGGRARLGLRQQSPKPRAGVR